MLTTLASVKLAMQLASTNTTLDAYIADAIPQVDALVKKHLGRNVEKVGACVAPTLAASLVNGSGLTSGQIYYWVITSLNLNGETTGSNEVNLTPSGSNLAATLTWNQVANAASYNIYRGTTSGGENILVANIPSPFTTSYTDSGAIQGSGSVPGTNTAIAGMTEFLDGTNTDVIVLGDPPVKVSELTALYYDSTGFGGQNPNGAFAANTLMTLGSDYMLKIDQRDGVTSKSGILRKLGGVWQGAFSYGSSVTPTLTPRPVFGAGNIKVLYNGGYAIVPADLQRTVNVLVRRFLAEGPSGYLFSSESTEDRSVTLPAGEGANNLFTPDIVQRLQAYARRRP